MMRRRRHRAFVLLDALGAVVIVTALGLSMLYAMRGYRAAMTKLNDAQQTILIAETTLVKLQAGDPPDPVPRDDIDTTITIQPLDEGHLLPGRRWVRLRVEHRGHEAELIGVVPIVSGGER
jgi:hypothetical protein